MKLINKFNRFAQILINATIIVFVIQVIATIIILMIMELEQIILVHLYIQLIYFKNFFFQNILKLESCKSGYISNGYCAAGRQSKIKGRTCAVNIFKKNNYND